MKNSLRVSLILIFITMLIIAACAPASRPTEMQVQELPAAQPAAEVAKPEAPVSDQSAVAAEAAPEPSVKQDNAVYNTSKDGVLAQGPVDPNRKIIKNAEVQILVEDTDTTIDRITQIADDVGGYIVSSKSWFIEEIGGKYKYATLTIGVPVDDFERGLRRIRDTSLEVLNEVTTGEDVSQEYVDLQSKLESLQATRARITGFLEEAKTVEEALVINDQLGQVENQINETLGRMNYLAGRSSFSTITVTINPKIREVTPTPTATPTVTPTALPTFTPTPWNPGKTFNQAGTKLGETYRSLVDGLIWIFVYVLPIFAPWIVIGLVVFFFIRRRKKTPPAPKE